MTEVTGNLDLFVKDGVGDSRELNTSDFAPVYALQLDEASATLMYVGEAEAGSATSAAAWRIKRINTSSGAVVTWADGDTAFDNVWNNRASLTYS